MRLWLNCIAVALVILGAVLFAQGPTLNSSQLRPPQYFTWIGGSDPNTSNLCNGPTVQGVPSAHFYDLAIMTGLMGVSGDTAYICLRGSNGLGTWVQFATAP